MAAPRPYTRSRKIFLKNLLIARAARGQDVRAFLTKAEPVTKAAAVKDEVRSRPRHVKSRTLQDVPAEHAPDDDLEVPATNCLAMLTIKGDEFCSIGFVTLADNQLIEFVADICARIALQSAQQISAA